MKRVLIQINKMMEKFFTWGLDTSSDQKVIRTDNENLCCKHIKQIGWISLPQFGIRHLNFNFCPCCGKKLERE